MLEPTGFQVCADRSFIDRVEELVGSGGVKVITESCCARKACTQRGSLSGASLCVKERLTLADVLRKLVEDAIDGFGVAADVGVGVARDLLC